MHTRTEDLLKIRDGEPIDTATRQRLLADPVARAEIERLERIRAELELLPELEPPGGIWRRIEARAAQARRPSGWRWAAGAAAAGLLVALVLVTLDGPARRGAQVPAQPPTGESGQASTGSLTESSTRAPTEASTRAPAEAPAGASVEASTEAPPARSLASGPFGVARVRGPAGYAPLVRESMRLERLMAQLPAKRPVMSFGTAGTIVGLEERIALVDTQLALGAAEGLDPEYTEALWSERVDLMSALFEVRFAQAEPIRQLSYLEE